MATQLKLSWIGSLRQWRKRYRGRTIYCGTGRGKTDRESYQRALQKFAIRKAEIDAEIADDQSISPYAHKMISLLLDEINKLQHPETANETKTRNPEWHPDKEDIEFARRVVSHHRATEAEKNRLNNRPTEEQIAEYTADIERLKQPSTQQPEQPTSIDEAIEQFLLEKNKLTEASRDRGGLSIVRFKTIGYNLQAFKKFCKANDVKQLVQLDSTFLMTYKLHLQTNDRISSTTAHEYLATLKQLLNWLFESHLVGTMPRNLKSLSIPVKLNGVKVWDIDEIRTLFAEATDKVKCYISLALNAALTQGDIASLQSDEIEDGYLVRERNKTLEKGTYKLWSITHDLIEKVRDNKTGEVFKITADGIATAFRKLIDKSSVEKDGRSFKHFRKSGATLIANEIAQGRPGIIKLYLSQSPQDIANKHYILNNPNALDETLDKLDEILGLKI